METQMIARACSCSRLCQLRQCAQASEWGRAAWLVGERHSCPDCVQFVARRAVQDQQWDLLLQLVESGVHWDLRNSLLQSALGHLHVQCTATLMDLGVSKHCREEGLQQQIAAGHGDFVLEVVRKVRDPDLTDFVLGESMKQSQWTLVSGLVKEGLSVAQIKSVCDQAVADQQWSVVIQLLRDGVGASEWIVSEIFQNKKVQDLLDFFPAGSMPEGLKGLLLLASVKHGLGDLTLHILQRETVSDTELMEAIKFAVHLLDKTIFLKLIQVCSRGRRVFKQRFVHHHWKEGLHVHHQELDGEGHSSEGKWIYKALCEGGEKDLALLVIATIPGEIPLVSAFCLDEENQCDLRQTKFQYALRKLYVYEFEIYQQLAEKLYHRPQTSQSDRSVLFRHAIRQGDQNLITEFCKHSVSRKDLKFAAGFLMGGANYNFLGRMSKKLKSVENNWLAEFRI